MVSLRRSTHAVLSVAFASAGLGGCFTTDLDRGASGVFVCGEVDACPSGLFCVNSVCQDAEGPEIDIIAPEPDQVIGVPGDGTIEVSLRIGGQNLDLVPAGGDHMAGQGHVDVFVDGILNTTLQAGSVSGQVSVPVSVPDTAGPVRFAARAIRNDGLPYDSPTAAATRLVWIDGGGPQVSLRRPWPGAEFDIESQDLEVEVAVLNFLMVPPAGGPEPTRGHAHLHHNDLFPSCAEVQTCDDGYIQVLSPTAGEFTSVAVNAVLPGAPEGEGTLTAILRNNDHSLFRDVDMNVVFDTVKILRVDRGE